MKIYPIIFAQLVAYHYIVVASKLPNQATAVMLTCLAVIGMLFVVFLCVENK